MRLLEMKRRWLAPPNFSKKNLGGFTMIELLIVIGITAVIATVSLANLVGWRSAKELNSTAQKIATLIREAESRAMSQDRGSAWGVHFEDDGANSPFFSLFYADKSGAYSPANEVERYPLPSAIRYEMLAGETEFLQDVVFDQITGRPRKAKYRKSDLTQSSADGLLSWRGAGTTNLTYEYVLMPGFEFEISSEKQSEKSKIIIDPSGTIAFDSLNCIFTCYVQQVVLLPPPVILSFSAAPTSTTPLGPPVTLSWTTVNADSCDGDPWTNSREANGSAVVMPSQTTAYSLTCSGGGGQTTAADVSVIVQAGLSGGKDAGDKANGRQRQAP